MKKILVTGATGFIGHYVVEELLRRNYNVVATSLAKEKARAIPWFEKIQYVEFDLGSFNDEINYFEFFHQPDALIHLAWEGLPNYQRDFHLTENYPRQLHFLKNMLENGLRDITVAGTCFEYGMQEGLLSEDMMPNPANAYAKAKDELRKDLQVLCSPAVPLKWIRLFYTYGKGQHPNSLVSQLDKALEEGQEIFNMSGGQQVRDFLPVQTMAEYIVAIATQNKITGIINCCSGNPVAVIDFINAYLSQQKKVIHLNTGYYPYTTYEPMRFWGDDTKLQSIIRNKQSQL